MKQNIYTIEYNGPIYIIKSDIYSSNNYGIKILSEKYFDRVRISCNNRFDALDKAYIIYCTHASKEFNIDKRAYIALNKFCFKIKETKEYHKYRFDGNKIYEMTNGILSSIDISKFIPYMKREVEASNNNEAIEEVIKHIKYAMDECKSSYNLDNVFIDINDISYIM